MIINPSAMTISNDVLAKYAGAEPATIGHFLNYGFSTEHFMTSIPGHSTIGRAVTLKLASADSTLLHKAPEFVGPGDILLIDRAGDRQYACLGGVVSYALKVRNVNAVIVDGAVTDICEIREMELPVYYRRLSPITTRLLGTDGELNTEISCGGVVVHPGDIVVVDENGFVVLNPAEAESILQRARDIQGTEPGKKARLRAGEFLAKIGRAQAIIDSVHAPERH